MTCLTASQAQQVLVSYSQTTVLFTDTSLMKRLMRFNATKSQIVESQVRVPLSLPQYTIHGHTLEAANSAKYLGRDRFRLYRIAICDAIWMIS